MQKISHFLIKNKEIIAFTIFEIIALFLNLVLTGKAEVISSKCIIYINLIFALIFTLRFDKKSYVIFALIFTAISDTLLVSTKPISDASRIIALVSFIIVQAIYLLELFKHNKKITIYIGLIDTLIIILLSIASIFIFKDNYNALIPLTIIYFIILVSNLINTSINFRSESTMFFGFLFFILCDVLVGLSTGVSIGILSSENEFIKFAIKLAKYEWTPYIIAQYFLVSSIISKNIKFIFKKREV